MKKSLSWIWNQFPIIGKFSPTYLSGKDRAA